MKEKLKEKLVDHLEKWWAINKAKGLMAQLLFKRELKAGVFSEHRRKFFGGCWILAPKREDFFKLRICFFVHPTVLESRPGDEVEPEAVMGEAEGLKFRMVAGFLNRAGMGVVYAVPTGSYRSLLRKYGGFFTGTMPQRKDCGESMKAPFSLDGEGGEGREGERNGIRI